MRPEDYDVDGLQIVENVAGAAREVTNPGVPKHLPWKELPRHSRDFYRDYARRLLAFFVGVQVWRRA